MKAFFAQQEPRPFQGYLLAGLIAVELLMSFSFLGYIHIRPISVTFAYIPVLLAGCLIGPKASVLLGLVFGLASMWKASAPVSYTHLESAITIPMGPMITSARRHATSTAFSPVAA